MKQPQFISVLQALVVVSLFTVSVPATAQVDQVESNQARALPLTPAVTVYEQDADGHVTVRAVRISTPIVVDGRLDDPIYQTVPAIDKFIQQLRRAGKTDTVLGNPARWGIPLRPLKITYKDRVLVAGDAAGQVKPTTGGGIYYSLLASGIASQVLAEALSDDDLSASRLGQYQRRWKSLLSKELEVGYSARRLFEALNDQQISSLVIQAGARGTHNDLFNSGGVSFDWHSKLIGRIIRHPVMGSALGLINPLLARLAHSPDQISDPSLGQSSDPSLSFTPATSSLSDPLPDSSL